MTRTCLRLFFFLAALGVNLSAFAGESPKTVVELFTSQGCSSCPPANEFVGDLADEDDEKLVLSYGVTYWDFLGWKDTFGSQEATQRQRDYGDALEMGFVYTPQIVLNGRKHSSSFSKKDVEKDRLTPKPDISLNLTIEDQFLNLEMNVPNALIVSYRPGWQYIDVERGENRGRRLRVANVVEDIAQIEQAGLTSIEIKDGMAYAALVHDPDSLAILAASIVRP